MYLLQKKYFAPINAENRMHSLFFMIFITVTYENKEQIFFSKQKSTSICHQIHLLLVFNGHFIYYSTHLYSFRLNSCFTFYPTLGSMVKVLWIKQKYPSSCLISSMCVREAGITKQNAYSSTSVSIQDFINIGTVLDYRNYCLRLSHKN